MNKRQEKRARKRFLKAAKRPRILNISSPDVILTQNYMTPAYRGINNLNTIIISAVGTGKTRGFLKSNLLSTNCSFVVTDTKGELYNEFSGWLQNECGYKIKLIDLAHPECSNHYNPFHYLHNEEDVCDFAMALSMNVHKNSNDSFWLYSAKNLIVACMLWIIESCPREEWNMNNVNALINIAEPIDISYTPIFQKDNESELDLLMKNLERSNPGSIAVKYYKSVKCASDKTWSSILVSAQQALSVFNFPRLLSLTASDDVNFELLGTDEKVALFINLDDTNNSYDFVAGLIYSQLFKVLYRIAEQNYKKSLPRHVRFFMDDFANYKIPSISHYLSTCRSRGISIQMVLQSEPQLRAFYGSEGDNLIANSTYVYIGNNDLKTQVDIANRLGVSVDKVQNNYNKTYVFSPNGYTIVDTNADYTKHVHYKCLDRYNFLHYRGDEPTIDLGIDTEASVIKPYDFWIDDIKIPYTYHDNCYTNKYNGIEIALRDSRFDSQEEEQFYNTLTNNIEFISSGVECNIHTDLRDIFDVNKIMDDKMKFHKLMLMHCDFVFRRNNEIILAVEIDGQQHRDDFKQKTNDMLKDDWFQEVKIPLLRITAKEIREDCATVVKKCTDILNNNIIAVKSSSNNNSFLNEEKFNELLNTTSSSNITD